jgi:anti-anti-sigma factor
MSPAAHAQPEDVARHATAPFRDDQLPLWSCTAELTPAPDGIIVVLRVSGEIDLLNHLELRIALTDCISGKPGHLVVDLASVTFCWAEGLALLVETAALAAADGTGYALSGLPATLRRHCTMMGGDALPSTYRTTAPAGTASPAGRARPAH